MTPTQNTEQRTLRVPVPTIKRREVKVPELPAADPKIRHKVRVHILLLICSGVLTVIISVAAHEPIGMWAFAPTMPNVLMECLDRLHNR